MADSELTSPSLKSKPIGLEWQELDDGRVSEEVLAEVLRQHSLGGQQDAAKDHNEIDVLIALLGLRSAVSHGQARHLEERTYAPCWLPARLNVINGQLTPHSQTFPWLARQHLAPEVARLPLVGSVTDMDSFLVDQPIPDGYGWQDYLKYAEELFASVAEAPPRKFSLAEWITIGPGLIVGSQVQGTAKTLIKLYDRLGEAKALPRLVDSLANRGAAEEIPPLTLEGASRHWGHMKRQFPLGPSQRESVHAVVRLQGGEEVAVNGPPGTGKTTLVQSLVASLWVERALEKAEPPVIVACSTNNQAVTNVLDSLILADEEANGVLTRRWIPSRTVTFGLFFPSQARLESAGKYSWACPGSPWSGLPASLENSAYCDEAREVYLRSAGDHFSGEPLPTIESVVDRLHQELRAEAKKLKARLSETRALIELRNRFAGDPEIARHEQQANLAEAEAELERRRRLKSAVEQQVTGLPLLEDLLAFLRPIRDRRNDRLLRPFAEYGFDGPMLPAAGFREVLRGAVAELLRECEENLSVCQETLKTISEWRDSELAFRQTIAELSETLADGRVGASDDEIFRDPGLIDHLLDMTHRYRLFHLAARYWEGRWLQEMATILREDTASLARQSKSACLARFRRFAKLTPLFVSTFHHLPKVFDYYRGSSTPLLEGIDLLIVDEAGQVAPEIGAPCFALAKKAVVVGDTWQIEPIWGVAEGTDHANLELSGLDAEQMEAIQANGLLSSSGSLMRVAQRCTRFSSQGQEDGLWLREHRRSVPGVIEYCNQLVYRGQLETLRPAIADHPLPAMAWANVQSPSVRVGSSWMNQGHAYSIAHWLKDRKDDLEAYYPGKNIGEIVGIITPYRRQTSEIQRQLRNVKLPVEDLGQEGIAVGTVHVFQGAERPIIIFSPTMTRQEPKGYFFDRGKNMLNVAVSRAKDSFVVIGDMSIFDTSLPTPSGVLASQWSLSNVLTDVIAAPVLAQLPKARRLDSHDEHNRVLLKALEDGRKRILIVSPYLGFAIRSEGLLDKIRDAVARGVPVTIAFNLEQQKSGGTLPWVRQLQRTGAEILGLPQIHNKTLAVDSLWIVEGSYNWLSAVRDPKSDFHNLEASVQVVLPDSAEVIERAWEQIEELRQTGDLKR